ncbi:hypothetical protein ACJMK2_015580 [Sinanodonta woodiana]|uniref:Calcium-activated chloride channel N-terminal domain-containing protein n=1 Tax=Sinanodonta woodiana TaxID=1069815 RepID=A0ABD3USW6_SINWO
MWIRWKPGLLPAHQLLLIVLLCKSETCSCISRPSNIVLENNGYINIVVAIHDSVTEDALLIDKIKHILNESSKVLYNATKKQAHFRDITILLPASWKTVTATSATTETLQFADVIVSDASTRDLHLPRARSYRGCGQQGIHVLLPTQFLNNPQEEPYYGKAEKYFIHAWAQFRWGVFQEYGEPGESPFYFSVKYGRPEAIRCVFFMRGMVSMKNGTTCLTQNYIDTKTGLYFDYCLWRPYPYNQRIQASMMDYQYIKEITTFCEDDEKNQQTLHNYESPSRHNRLCEHRSTWDIILHTEDFAGGKNQPKDISESELVPRFRLVKATSRKKRIPSSAPVKNYQKELSTRLDIHVVEADTGRSYVELYVHVMQGFMPVVGMKVMATVNDPHEKQTTMILYDNGAGIDMTKDDGIYSRAFTNLTLPGRYKVSARVENTGYTFALDSVMDDFDIPLKSKTVKRSIHEPTVRQLTGHIFDISLAKDLNTTKDVIPPSRIADLHVVEISKVNKTAILSWTAPGDNLDDEKVDHYELFSCVNIDDVRELLSVTSKHYLPVHKSVRTNIVPSGVTFGLQEHYVWKAPPDQVDFHRKLHYAIVIRGVDNVGNAGKLSNIVTFSLS